MLRAAKPPIVLVSAGTLLACAVGPQPKLFIGFYGTAIARRGRATLHKRMIVLASASVLPAAIFRIIVGLTGVYWLATAGGVMPAAFFLPAVSIVIGMAHDRVARGSVHPVYLVGLPVLLLS